MRHVGDGGQQIHLGVKIEIGFPERGAARPAEALVSAAPDRGEEGHRRMQVARAQSQLGCGEGEVLGAVAGLERRRAVVVDAGPAGAQQDIVASARVFDDRRQDPAHVGKEQPAAADTRGPLHLDRVGRAEAFAGIGCVPEQARQSRRAPRIVEPETRFGRHPAVPVPAGGNDGLEPQ